MSMSESKTVVINGFGSITLLKCSACNSKIVVQRATGEIVLLQRTVIVRQGKVYATCPQCKKENHIESMSYETQRVILDESQDLSQDKK